VFNIFYKKQGFAFIGLLISVVIIACLAFGSFYFSSKKTGEANELKGKNDIETLLNVKKKINEINKQVLDRSKGTEEKLENAATSTDPITNQLVN
jgi:hypothetical protein